MASGDPPLSLEAPSAPRDNGVPVIIVASWVGVMHLCRRWTAMNMPPSADFVGQPVAERPRLSKANLHWKGVSYNKKDHTGTAQKSSDLTE
jgi:hypothetical protein